MPFDNTGKEKTIMNKKLVQILALTAILTVGGVSNKEGYCDSCVCKLMLVDLWPRWEVYDITKKEWLKLSNNMYATSATKKECEEISTKDN